MECTVHVSGYQLHYAHPRTQSLSIIVSFKAVHHWLRTIAIDFDHMHWRPHCTHWTLSAIFREPKIETSPFRQTFTRFLSYFCHNKPFSALPWRPKWWHEDQSLTCHGGPRSSNESCTVWSTMSWLRLIGSARMAEYKAWSDIATNTWGPYDMDRPYGFSMW